MHRRVWPLNRLGLERDLRERPEPAFVCDGVLRPQPAAHGQRLLEPRASVVEPVAGRRPFLPQPSGSDAKLHPAAGNDVQGRDRPCRDEGMAQRELVHVGAEPNPRRHRGERGKIDEHVEGRGCRVDRELALRVLPVAERRGQYEMIRHPHRLEPKPLGLLRNLGPQ
jgi:hypothetical protein